MIATMKANFRTIRFVDAASTLGQTAGHTLDAGSIIKWKAKASLNGKMERYTQASLRMIRERDTARLSGLTATNTSVNGRLASSMESEPM